MPLNTLINSITHWCTRTFASKADAASAADLEALKESTATAVTDLEALEARVTALEAASAS